MSRRLRKPHLQGLFAPVSLVCYNFMPKDNDEKRRVTVIIAPIKVVEFEDGSLGVSFGCSRGHSATTHTADTQKLRKTRTHPSSVCFAYLGKDIEKHRKPNNSHISIHSTSLFSIYNNAFKAAINYLGESLKQKMY